MAYSPTYTSSDLSPIVTDIVASGAVEIVSFVGIIVILSILVWVMARLRKVRG